MKNSIDPHYRSEYPESWETRSILSLGQFIQGAGFPEDLQGKLSEQFPFFKVSDFNLERNEKTLKDHSNSISEKTRKILGAKIVPTGSVVFAKVGAALLLNRRRITIRNSIIDNNCAAIFPKKGIDLEFLFQTMCNIDFGNYVQPGAVPSINQGVLDSILINIPKSFEEQQKIASVLMTVDKAIEKTKVLIEKNMNIKQGLMKDLFMKGDDKRGKPISYRETTLGKECDEIYRYPTYYDIKYVPSGVREIRGELISDNGSIDLKSDNQRYISEKTSRKFPRTILKEGDFIISVRGTMGKIGYISSEIAGSNITANLIRISPNRKRIFPPWLKQYFLGPVFQAELEYLSSATTIKTIKSPDLKSIKLFVPSIDEQIKLTNILESVDSKIEGEKKYLEKLIILKSGLMQDLLTGKVRVKVAE